MPTPEEIKKIAREYAESTNPDKPYDTLSDGEKKLRDFGIEQVYIPLLEWLSKDYAIVPKSKLQGEYKKSYSAAFEHTTCLDRQYARGRYQVLREIFGKSLSDEK